MEQQPVTMNDVARAAGVSVTTVSYVLSGKRRVAPGTADAVQAAIAKLGFRLNTVAQSLRTGQSRTVALIIPDIANPFYAQLARGLQDALRPARYHVVVCNTNADRAEELFYLDDTVRRRLDGVVITPMWLVPNDFDAVRAANIPVVVSADAALGDLDLVRADSHEAVDRAVGHLARQGHERLGMLVGPAGTPAGDPRLDLFRAAAGRHGLDLPAGLIVRGKHTREAGAAGLRRLMSRRNPPTAIACVNDRTAVGALEAAERMGLAVPSDVALIGHDDIEIASLVRPRLSTIRYPAHEVGSTCGRLFLERREGRASPAQVALRTRLVLRETT
ncbi:MULTISPECIES: LacI family DNA-binding transcriptional regulator [unclassified Streptomyces]|uniref:LacI family DNA-binding transcriptional regulator n=1 Tax=unclassified Streptomyces TaxID=2593676 RepID=UPI00344B00C9